MILSPIIDQIRTVAYIDPGVGSLVIQVIAAVALSGLITLRVYWKKVINVFRRKHNK